MAKKKLINLSKEEENIMATAKVSKNLKGGALIGERSSY